METVQLKQQHRPLYAVQPERSHPRLSLRRVLYSKFLRWLDSARAHTLRKIFLRLTATVLFFSAIFFPVFTLGVLVDVFQWNQYRIPIGLSLFLLGWNAKSICRFFRRRRKATGNASTFHGIPVDEFATYLTEYGFKQSHAIKTLGLSNGRYKKIAQRLDDTKVCIRDENNGRQVNPALSREQLVRQLREDFPLVYDDHRKEWIERDGSWERYLRDQEAKEQNERKRVERLERRAKKANQTIQEAFTRRQLVA